MIDSHIELPDGGESLDFLDDALEFSGVSGVLAVQREPSGIANRSCLNLAAQSDGLVCGVVAWAPVADDRLLRIQLDADSREPLLRGYAIDIHDRETGAWAGDENVHHGVGLIAGSGKPLDLVLAPRQLPMMLPFLDAHPDLHVVLDHCLGEPAESGGAWQRLLRETGRRPHVSYRLSGLAGVACAETACEATERVKEAFDAALEGFGTRRLLYASGWPVTPARYPVWLNTVDNLVHTLSADERADIFGNNAAEAYHVC